MQEDRSQMSGKKDFEMSWRLECKDLRFAANSAYEQENSGVKGKDDPRFQQSTVARCIATLRGKDAYRTSQLQYCSTTEMILCDQRTYRLTDGSTGAALLLAICLQVQNV